MSTIQDLFQQTQLSEAAYADFMDENGNLLTDDNDVIDALEVNGMSQSQAVNFVDRWRVETQIPDTDLKNNTYEMKQ